MLVCGWNLPQHQYRQLGAEILNSKMNLSRATVQVWKMLDTFLPVVLLTILTA